MLVTDFTEDYPNATPMDEVQCDLDADDNINSAIQSIQAKTLEMQMLESDVEQELRQKNTQKEIVSAQIESLKSGNNSASTLLDCSLVTLVEPNQKPDQKHQKIESGPFPLSLNIQENTWKIIHQRSSNIIASIDIYNNSKWIVDDIEVFICDIQNEVKSVHQLIKLDVERNQDKSSKRQKFEESQSLLTPGQRGKLGIMLDMSDHGDTSLNMSLMVTISWTANDIKQQKDMIFNLNLIDTNPPSVFNSEVFIGDLHVMNAFQTQTSLMLISLHSNLNHVHSIFNNCSTFKFKGRAEDNMLFSELNYPGRNDHTMTAWILPLESHKANLQLYTSCTTDVLFIVKKLYEDPKFPTDIIILANQPDTKYLKQKVLISLKNELSHVYNIVRDKLSSSVTEPGSSSTNINIIDTIRQSFHATQRDLKKEIIFTAADYENLLADFRKVQNITDEDVSNLCDTQNM